MADGHLNGDDLICGLHGWDCRHDTGGSAYNNSEVLPRFDLWIEGDDVLVDAGQIEARRQARPQPFDRDAYLGLYPDAHGAEDEPPNAHIQRLARDGSSKVGHHGPVAAVGGPRSRVPSWHGLPLLAAQLHRAPLLEVRALGHRAGVRGPVRDALKTTGV